MLSNKKKKMVEEVIYCAKCDREMKRVVLPRYEYVPGYPLRNVNAYRCARCGETFFTEEQAKGMEIATKELKELMFGFERKLTVSGRSLVLPIPRDLVVHLRFKPGHRVRIYPVNSKEMIVRKK